MSDSSEPDLQLLSVDGAPEPVMGPLLRRSSHPVIADGGDNLIAELALSQDSLEQSMGEESSEYEERADTSDTVIREAPLVEATTTEYESLESSRGPSRLLPSASPIRDGVYTPETLEDDDITNRLEPLVPVNTPSFISAVLDRILPELTKSLDVEYNQNRNGLEREHRARLQSLHSQHHHAQFELYEKVIQLQDKVQNLEDELSTRNKIVDNLSMIVIRKMDERTIAGVISHWRHMCEIRKEEQKRLEMMDVLHRRNILRKYFSIWKNTIKSKWKTKVEKVCKERATEICIRLKDDLTSDINRLEQEVRTRDDIISKIEKKAGNVEENLSKALMRGLCALNMETMSVLQKPEHDQASLENLEFSSKQPKIPGSLGQPLASNISRQNTMKSAVNSIAPQPRAAGVASNIYIDTVSSLEDFGTSRKLKVRNSSEYLGTIAGRRDHLSKSGRGPVAYKHDGMKTTKVKGPAKASDPWRPVGSKSKMPESPQRPTSGPRHGFTAVKHH